jgi:hypothetical protein
MKQINETFEDKEHDKLRKQKEKLNLNWHDYFLLLSKFYEDNNGDKN